MLQTAAEPLIWVLGLILFFGLSAACEAGFRFGRWRKARVSTAEDEVSATSTITAGMLTLLAFILGLTINFAQNRFEARRDMVAVEANTIGTAWLRAKLVGGPDGDALAARIADYAKTRLAFTRADYGGPVDRLNAQTDSQQKAIWALVTSVARNSPTAVSATLINAVNDMIDASLSQRYAFEARVPGNMIYVLGLGTLIAIAAMGYQLGLVGYRQPVLTSLLLLMWTGGIVTTIDLNRPRLGNIRVETTPLEWTIDGFKAPPAAPSAPVGDPQP
jgi:hypothetical protein